MKKQEEIIELFVKKTSLLKEVSKSKRYAGDFEIRDFKNLLALKEITNASEKLDILEDHYTRIDSRLYNPGNGKLYTFRKPLNFNNDSVCGLDHCLFSLTSKRPIVVKQEELRIFEFGFDKAFNSKSKLEKDVKYNKIEITDAEALMEELKRTDFYYSLEAGMYLYYIDLTYEKYDIIVEKKGYDMILF